MVLRLWQHASRLRTGRAMCLPTAIGVLSGLSRSHSSLEGIPFVVTLPQLSPAMKNGTISRWVLDVGDPVTAGEVFLELSTSTLLEETGPPVTMEVEAHEVKCQQWAYCVLEPWAGSNFA